MSVITNQKNINLETVENCNLLCKLILDYMDTDKCIIERESEKSFRIVYPEGSFINYRDTNYELTYAYFFYPSRHSIDGQKYDLEINLYHGRFGNTKGMVTHTHYHDDEEKSKNFHKHFHYHLKDDNAGDVHLTAQEDTDHIDKNIITCLMYNKGKHDGSDLNIFFNQFVHHPKFKELAVGPDRTSGPHSIEVHDHWTIENLYPKKRSFFIYDEDRPSSTITNTYVVFDTVQTISKEIIDRLYARGIKGSSTHDISESHQYQPTNATGVKYRNNIEVITDAAYKKSMRAQIKDLLSLTRMSSYKPASRTAKEYNDIGDRIIDTYINGDNVGFFQDQNKSKEISKLWDNYSQDIKELRLSDEITDSETSKKIIISSELANVYKYTSNILNFKSPGSPGSFNDSIYPDYFDTNNFEYYLKARKSLSYLFNIFKDWKDHVNEKYFRENKKSNATFFTTRTTMNSRQDPTEYSAADGGDPTYIFAMLVSALCAKGGIDTTSNYDIRNEFPGVTAFNFTVSEGSPGSLTEWGKTVKNNGMEGNENKKRVSILENIWNCRNLFSRIVRDEPHSYTRALELRIFFEDIDLEWQRKHNCESNIYSTLLEGYRQSGDGEDTSVINDKTLENLHLTGDILNPQTNFKTPTDFIFLTKGLTLDRTISNEECQPWQSNQVHYEGDLWKFWENNLEIDSNAKFDWINLTPLYKEKIKDGLLRWNGSKWVTHNQCRNPGNRGAAPWCYTKNPNKRWEYCAKPYYSNILGRIILILIFIFLGVIAFFTIKTLFLHEYPMRFVEKITGGKMASTETMAGATPTA
jgi:carbonic anhydrase